MMLTLNNASTLDTEPMRLIETDVAEHYAAMLDLWPRIVRGTPSEGSPEQ